MKYLIIGTAGHVDHGKSALIKSLTGIETDRLKEEKQRGISIDLGFASLPLDEEITAGIVDVPGHERFLKNMLAGTGGIDLAMLVIAADEGVMPQTREHLAMLHLYGVRHGVVAVNKVDKVEPEWLELVEEDIRQALAGTFLAEAAFCRVSALNGQGLEELKAALLSVARKAPSRDRMAPFRLWIDRSFTAHGYGAVVTGSVLSGTARTGDTLTLYPSGVPVRVRGLEWHGAKAESVYAGQRAAINISGLDLTQVSRGMFLSAAGRGESSELWDMAVQWHGEPVSPGTRVRLHIGTGEYLGRLYGYKNQETSLQRLLLEQPLAAGAGDRGILRLYSPQHLLGGATLIAPGRPSRKMSMERQQFAQAVMAGSCEQIVLALLKDNRHPLTIEAIKRKVGYLADKAIGNAITKLTGSGEIIALGEVLTAKSNAERLTSETCELLAEQHRRQPDRAGLSREIVKQQLELEDRVFDSFIARWQQEGAITALGGDLALAAHAAKHQSWQGDLAQKAEQAFEGIGLTNVAAALISAKLSLSPDNGRKAFDMLLKGGHLVKIGDIFVYRKTIQYIAKCMQDHFQDHSTLTVAELRDLLNTSRKIALPLMEYFDLHKYTIRDGDLRRPGPKTKDLSE